MRLSIAGRVSLRIIQTFSQAPGARVRLVDLYRLLNHKQLIKKSRIVSTNPINTPADAIMLSLCGIFCAGHRRRRRQKKVACSGTSFQDPRHREALIRYNDRVMDLTAEIFFHVFISNPKIYLRLRTR
jgi:hypothetical protein